MPQLSQLKLEKDEIKVVIELPHYYWGGTRKTTSYVVDDADKIVAQIKRHVDLENAEIKIEWSMVCPHCFSDPDLDEEGPTCCAKLLADWNALKEKEKPNA